MSASIQFSVAINAYNREHEIGATLDSILAQSLPAAEIIVVDDGSTDGTANVVRGYGPSVKLILTENAGPGQSRHRAVSACTGEWIATCDSDDLWHPDHLASLCETVQRFPETVLVFSNTTRFIDDTEDGHDHFASLPDGWWNNACAESEGPHRRLIKDAYLSLLQANPVYPSCQAFYASAYRGIGGAAPEVGRLSSEDSDITRRLSLAGTVTANARVTVAMRKHAHNWSASRANGQYGKAIILGRHLDSGVLPEQYRAPVAEERIRSILRAFRHACWEDNLTTARACLALRPRPRLLLRDRIRYLRLEFRFLRSRSHI